MTQPSVGIIGGGLLGLTAALRLAQDGVRTEVFERAGELGGLVGSFELEGARVDRFYHVVLPSDDRVRGLAGELGLGGRFRFRPARVGFYDAGRLLSMTSPLEFARFPLLRPAERLRLAAFVARCGLERDHAALDETPLLEWLERQCGRGVVERLWRPLLDSKFDGRYDDLPATYIWARTRRMGTTRDRSGREVMGWLDGGYQTLVDAIAARLRALGGHVHVRTPVDRVVVERGRVAGIVVAGRLRPFDQVLCTLPPRQARPLLGPALGPAVGDDHCRYLGVACLVLRLRRSLSPFYHLNITDRRVPLTTVVETTHVVDPGRVGGHLVYLAKYVQPDHPLLDVPAAEAERALLGHARAMFPALADADVLAARVQRARVTEPVHLLGGARRLPGMFPAPGLALASTANVYPEIVSGQAVIGVADRVVAGIRERLPAPLELAA